LVDSRHPSRRRGPRVFHLTDSVTLLKIFINDTPVSVKENDTVGQAVKNHDPQLASSSETGGYLTDGTGRRIDASAKVEEGLIVRAVVGAPNSEDGE
jgi:hypothetical protein